MYFFTSPGGNNWTRVALGYREHADEFAKKNLVVYGINDKDAEVAKNWVEEQSLPFSVLMDYGRTVGIAYGMSEKDSDRYVANAAEGRRPAVLVDEEGLIAAWEPDINSVEKVAELLASI